MLQKFLPIGPSFPIRIWLPRKAWWFALRGYSRMGGFNEVREYFANYVRQYKYRLPLEHFVPGSTI